MLLILRNVCVSKKVGNSYLLQIFPLCESVRYMLIFSIHFLFKTLLECIQQKLPKKKNQTTLNILLITNHCYWASHNLKMMLKTRMCPLINIITKFTSLLTETEKINKYLNVIRNFPSFISESLYLHLQ